jgi:hypothetical protein
MNMTVKELNDTLMETLNEVANEGESVGEHKSHIALILAFTNFQWGPKNGYKDGRVTLNAEEFSHASGSTRKHTIKSFLSSIIGDAYTNMLMSKKGP